MDPSLSEMKVAAQSPAGRALWARDRREEGADVGVLSRGSSLRVRGQNQGFSNLNGGGGGGAGKQITSVFSPTSSGN